ncbi:hypothetical protein AMAG_10035 [Allomyces macrogynus ATCC 38327]|uniref:Uncharacterized protein n=1 Tax=Allomyces macrogynus (strain ATCC 38327) TaxID=578462 RepID=A0A0L0SQ54_ALLM3|nr:hypothetical protein AMAG_10035 [Allomyces macrogynus ATCC 38327]|eukprot:KNE64683.1 hypothetical protein AMAG_10035 [Allomyces macrogynus ATCC 38327]
MAANTNAATASYAKTPLLVFPSAAVVDAATVLRSLVLPNPSTGEPTTYLTPAPRDGAPNSGAAHEDRGDFVLLALDYAPSETSAFVDDAVLSDASMAVMTPFDPVFLLLRLACDRAEHRPVLLDDLMHDPLFPDLAHLGNHHAVHLHRLLMTYLCDVVTSPGITAYRLAPSKVRHFLIAKTEQLAAHFAANAADMYPPESRTAADAVRWHRRAVETLGEWVADRWITDVLLAHYQFPAEKKPDAMDALVQAAIQGRNTGKRAAGGSGGKSEPAPKAKKAAPPPKPVGKNQKTLSSFFTKKS